MKPELLPGLPGGQAFHFAFDADGAPLVFSMSGGRRIWRWDESAKSWNVLLSESDVGPISALRQDARGAVLMASEPGAAQGTPLRFRWLRIVNGAAVPLGGFTTCDNAYWIGTRPDGTSVCSDGTNLFLLPAGAAEWQPWLTTAKRVANWRGGIMLPDGTLLNFSDSDTGNGVTALSADGVLTEVLDCNTALLRNCRAASGAPRLASDGRVHFLVGGGNDFADHDIVALTPGTWATEKLVNFGSEVPDNSGGLFTARVNSFALGKNDDWFVLRKEEYDDAAPHWLVGSTVRDGAAKVITNTLQGSGDLYRRGDWLYYFRYSSPASVTRFSL